MHFLGFLFVFSSRKQKCTGEGHAFYSYTHSTICPLIHSFIFVENLFYRLLLFSFSAMSDSLRPHGLHHTRLPCLSPSSGVCSNSYPFVGLRGGVCNFLSSVLLQQKFEAVDGPVLQLRVTALFYLESEVKVLSRV